MKVDGSLDLTQGELQKGDKEYADWHWFQQGNTPVKVVDWNDKDMPRMLIECGKLIRLHLRMPRARGNKGHPRRERDTMIEFSKEVSGNSHIAYDPNQPDERLYLLIGGRAKDALKRRFWDENGVDPLPLKEVARLAGGKHGKRGDYPNVMVKPAGVLTAVVYHTNKKEDGPSYYIHKMGELSHNFPILCVDQKGRLWLAGGNYTCPTPGITD